MAMGFGLSGGPVVLEAGMLTVTRRVLGKVVDVHRVVESGGYVDVELVAVVGDETTARRLMPSGWDEIRMPSGWDEIRWRGDSFWRRRR